MKRFLIDGADDGAEGGTGKGVVVEGGVDVFLAREGGVGGVDAWDVGIGFMVPASDCEVESGEGEDAVEEVGGGEGCSGDFDLVVGRVEGELDYAAVGYGGPAVHEFELEEGIQGLYFGMD